MSSVAVLIPWAGECPHRSNALKYVTAWYHDNHPAWRVHFGHSGTGAAWCKAEAIRDALRQTSADILVIGDADCIAPKVAEAVHAVSEKYAWAMPHYTVHRLNQRATRDYMIGADPAAYPRTAMYYAQMPYTGYAGGGIAVVSRSAYHAAPMDPRFTGWGQEDESWAMALRMLYGAPWRPRSGPLWHLWHPPQPRMSRAVGSKNSKDLRSQYRRIRTPEAMAEHLAPARAFLQAPAHPDVACSASQG